ncbi:MAG: phosphate ABC transporter substrate-binding protein [Spirochaetia bacterium]|nr:phosphate ABC transporter substrate-binding protein [Spirochaetia bacterium]
MKKLLNSMMCVMAATSLGFVSCKNDVNITVSGSSSVAPVMEKLAAEYEKTNNVRITVHTSSSGAGISDTQNGLNDFGMSSRELKSSEEGVSGETLCMDGIALVVGKGCSVSNVNFSDVKALFEKGTQIPGTPITAGVGRDASSGTRSAFDELLKIEGEYDSTVATLAETGNVIEAIQGSDNSIGYISFGSLKDTVKAVSLDGVKCSADTIKNKSYSLQRPFVLVTSDKKELSPAAKKFYDFCMSSEAQKIISGSGYISVR